MKKTFRFNIEGKLVEVLPVVQPNWSAPPKLPSYVWETLSQRQYFFGIDYGKGEQ